MSRGSGAGAVFLLAMLLLAVRHLAACSYDRTTIPISDAAIKAPSPGATTPALGTPERPTPEADAGCGQDEVCDAGCGQDQLCEPPDSCSGGADGGGCSCSRGYEEVQGLCVDVDECARGNPCDALKSCHNTKGGYSCGPCPAGYQDQAGSCVDIDECQRADACDPLESCHNTPGSYSCGSCPGGYQDKGGTCVDVDECQHADACDALKSCHNTTGGYTCGPCPAGYQDKAGSCVDVDECQRTDACDALKTCHNTAGGYSCGPCPAGYEDDQGHCTDIDECAIGNDCDPLAFCANSPGTYTCRCPAYFDDPAAGRQCDDTRFEWQLTGPMFGMQAIPHGADLLLATTIDTDVTIDGVTISTVGDKDFFAARLDSNRKLLWQRRFGGANDDRVMWAEADSAGNLLVTGYTDGGLDLGDGPVDTGGKRARFLAKLSAEDGSPLWHKYLYNIDLPPPTDQWEGFVSADRSNNVLLTGRFQNTLQVDSVSLTSAGSWDLFVAKFSPDGTLLWARRWGSTGNDDGRAVVADSNEDIFVAGVFDQSIAFGTSSLTSQGGMDVFLAKLNPDGDSLWSRRMGGGSTDECGRLALDAEGNALIAGDFYGTASFGGTSSYTAQDWDAWIAKWSGDGAPLWSRQIGGAATDVIWGISSGPSNEVVVAGPFQQTVDFGEGPRTAAGSYDAFVAKYASDGSFVWSDTLGASGWDTAAGVRTDETGRVYATGWYTAPIDLGGGPLDGSGMFLLVLKP